MIAGSGRSPGEGNGIPLYYSCMGNPMDREALWATVQRVAKTQTRLMIEHSTNMFQMLANAKLCTRYGVKEEMSLHFSKVSSNDSD